MTMRRPKRSKRAYCTFMLMNGGAIWPLLQTIHPYYAKEERNMFLECSDANKVKKKKSMIKKGRIFSHVTTI